MIYIPSDHRLQTMFTGIDEILRISINFHIKQLSFKILKMLIGTSQAHRLMFESFIRQCLKPKGVNKQSLSARHAVPLSDLL